MMTITLPDELNLSSSKSIMVYDYESSTEISKQQILLNKNTFSFLQEGTKEVFFYYLTSSPQTKTILLQHQHKQLALSFPKIRHLS